MGVQDMPPAPGTGQWGIPQQYPPGYPPMYPQSQQSFNHVAPISYQAPGVPAPAMSSPEPASGGSARKRKAPAAGIDVIDLTEDSPPSKAPKRKQQSKENISASSRGRAEVGGPKKEAPLNSPVKGKKKQPSKDPTETGETPKKKAKQPKDGEKRLRRWRNHAPGAYQEVRERALTQRMFVLDRQRSDGDADHPIETIHLAGTTGNLYTITVDKVPTCDCPHAAKGNQCKHIVYVLSRVLRAPTELEYQLAFTSSELKDMFAKAPPLPSETAASDEGKDGNRKPVEGECPICCVDFEPESSETIVYCRAACGNNIHKDCFSQWAATKSGQNVTCPFCRMPWQGDEEQLKDVVKSGSKNADGYVNVASQLGISGRRDYSTYNSYWVNRQARNGEIAWDEDGVMDHEYYGVRGYR